MDWITDGIVNYWIFVKYNKMSSGSTVVELSYEWQRQGWGGQSGHNVKNVNNNNTSSEKCYKILYEKKNGKLIIEKKSFYFSSLVKFWNLYFKVHKMNLW